MDGSEYQAPQVAANHTYGEDTMKKLRLSREVLAELAPDELRAVAGGTHLACNVTDTCTHAAACAVINSGQLACYTLDPRQCFGFTTPAGCITSTCM